MSAERKPDLHLEIAHVLFIDVVGYSKLLADEQSETLQLLNQIVRGTAEFRTAEDKGELIRLPTGDGMALVYLTKPEAPVQCALEISKAIKSYPGLQLRMGIHSGSVNQMRDVNDRSNVTGAGINIAQRVMDCGDAGHILLSRRVAEDLEQYRLWQPHLHDLGECEVKHGLRVHVFNLYTDEVGNRDVPAKLKPIAQEPAAAVATSAGGSARNKYRLIAATVLLVIALALGFVFWVASHRAQPVAPVPAATTAAQEKTEQGPREEGLHRVQTEQEIAATPLPSPSSTPRQAISLADLAEKISPSVVTITTYNSNWKALKFGTGFFVGTDGSIATNWHVIAGASYITAKTAAGEILPVQGIKVYDVDLDVATVWVNPVAGLYPFPSIGKYQKLPPRVGTNVIVLGNPEGFEQSLSQGIVSAVRSHNGGTMIQITAAVSEGSSGSPVMDETGALLGIATSQHEGQNLNFARSYADLAALSGNPRTLEEARKERYWAWVNSGLSGKAIAARKANNIQAEAQANADMLDQFPDVSDAHAYAATFFSYVKEYKRAIDELEQALLLDPSDPALWKRLSDIYFVIGQPQFGKEFADIAAQLSAKKAIPITPTGMPPFPTNAQGSQEQVASPKTDADFDKIPIGAKFIDPQDGKIYIKKSERTQPSKDANQGSTTAVAESPASAPAATPQPASSIESATAEIRKAKPVLSESPASAPSATPRPRLIYAPAPSFPSGQSLPGQSGTGRFRLTFDGAGNVTDIHIVTSTGNPHFDQAAIKTLRQWKSAPSQGWQATVPVTFSTRF